MTSSDSGGADEASITNDSSFHNEAQPTTSPSAPPISSEIALICVSGMAEIDAVKDWCTVVAQVCGFSFLILLRRSIPTKLQRHQRGWNVTA